jgi:hypothetical protein
MLYRTVVYAVYQSADGGGAMHLQYRVLEAGAYISTDTDIRGVGSNRNQDFRLETDTSYVGSIYYMLGLRNTARQYYKA